MNATSAPSAPGRGCSSISRDAARLQLRSAAWMSSTRSVMWCRPGPRFSTYFAIARIRRGRLEQLRDSDLADRHGMKCARTRCDAHLFRRLDLEAERVAIERQRRAEIVHGDADVIEDGFHVRSGPSRQSARARDDSDNRALTSTAISRPPPYTDRARARRCDRPSRVSSPGASTSRSRWSMNRCDTSSRSRYSLRVAAPRRLRAAARASRNCRDRRRPAPARPRRSSPPS